MKYLFIFLPFFAFGQDTIVRGSDTLIIGRTYYDDPAFYKEWTRVGKYTLPTGSTLYEVRLDSMFLTKSSKSYQQLYLEDRSYELVDSFRYNGAYYELRENGWYKLLLAGCDSHIVNESSVMNRDKIEPCKVKILVWTGCSFIEMDAVRFCGYNYDGPADGITPIKDYVVSYRSDGKWIKPSHVIKEL